MFGEYGSFWGIYLLEKYQNFIVFGQLDVLLSSNLQTPDEYKTKNVLKPGL